MDTNKGANNTSDDTEIDLLDLAKRIWNKRRFILKTMIVGLLVGVVISFSIPKIYKTDVILAPEQNNGSSTGNIGALAAMAGVNIGGGQQEDALASPDIFPRLLESTPFIMGLFNIKVSDKKGNIDTTLFTYLKDHQKKTWWNAIVSFPLKIKKTIFSSSENDEHLDRLSITSDQEKIFNDLKNSLNVEVDKKTAIITLSSSMQSPEISAYIADTLTSYLQNYIITYRTQKARQDLKFAEELYNEAQQNYYKAQQNYATYTDENLNVISARYRINQERLQNEMSLAYGVYTQMAQHLQTARVKVQDTTPVYTVIQPAVIPLTPEKPQKTLVIIACILLSVVISCLWVLTEDVRSQFSHHLKK